MLYAEGNRLMNLTDKHSRGFERKKSARLGTEKNPASVVVQTEEREQELAAIFEENGWFYTIEVDEELQEDISDLELLKNLPTTKVVEKTPGRNDPCVCGSGKKYKKCCG
ncbi:PBPRA1643 family SWIM/SEC-C metal-binding motif protein [Endozoicomonas numazuensis]|nr:PBPRA1643 family SWIM/SEC-C metal-binding motif protein [Endozoicomonas numazuensis]